MRLTLDAAPPRLSLSVVLAVPLVYAVFLGASLLIQVDEIVLLERPQRVLPPIVPQKDKIEPIEKDWLLDKLVLAEKPPPFKTASVTTTGSAPDIYIPEPELGGFAIDRIKPPVAAVTPIAGRDITPVRPPAPVVPGAAIARGISGSCDVVFDVDTRGRPFNLVANCTHDVFRDEAVRAVGKAEFLPKIRNGVAVEQRGAVYPLEFKVE